MATVSDVREQLVEAGMRVLERDGLPALSARKLAAETGTSTMAVYTHFGGMTGVLDAIAGEAFVRFTRALTEVEQTDDPVADFFVMGVRYREFALANPQRYQMMFGTSSPESLNRLPRRSHRHRQRHRPRRVRRCRSRRCWTWCAG